MITTCTTCGKCYEAGSEEQANEPTRFCPACKPKPASPEARYEKFRNAILDAGARCLWSGVPFREAAFRLDCYDTPRGVIIVQVFQKDHGFEIYDASRTPSKIDECIAWAMSKPAGGAP